MNPVSLTPIFARIFDAIDRRDQGNAYVLSGCVASAAGVGTRQVNVSNGSIVAGTGAVLSPGPQNVTPGALANPLASRCDLIYYPSGSTVLTLAAGAEVVVAPGQPAVPPALPAGACAIALAYIVPGAIDYSGATSAFVENIQQNGVNIPYFGVGPWPADGAVRITKSDGAGSQFITGRNQANTADLYLLGAKTNDELQMNPALNVLGDHIALGSLPATSGYVRIPNGQNVVGRNSTNTGDLPMIQGSTINDILVDPNGIGTRTGAHLIVGANAAGAGQVRLPNTAVVDWRNVANSGNLRGVEFDVNDSWAAGEPGTRHIFRGSSLEVGATPAAAGVIRIPSQSQITSRNAGNTGDVGIVLAQADNKVRFDNDVKGSLFYGNVAIIAGGAVAHATVGAIQLNNATYMYSRNAANTGDLGVVGIAGDNILRLYDSRIAAQQTALTALADGTGHVVAGAAYWRN